MKKILLICCLFIIFCGCTFVVEIKDGKDPVYFYACDYEKETIEYGTIRDIPEEIKQSFKGS